MDRADQARRLRHYGLEMLQLAAAMDAELAAEADVETDQLGRLTCCGAGTDQRDARTGERLHLLGCPDIAAAGLASCRAALGGPA